MFDVCLSSLLFTVSRRDTAVLLFVVKGSLTLDEENI